MYHRLPVNHVESCENKSLNAFIVEAIKEKMERES